MDSASDRETEFLRLSIVTTLAEWMERDPEAAEQWSRLTPEDLPELESAP